MLPSASKASCLHGRLSSIDDRRTRSAVPVPEQRGREAAAARAGVTRMSFGPAPRSIALSPIEAPSFSGRLGSDVRSHREATWP